MKCAVDLVLHSFFENTAFVNSVVLGVQFCVSEGLAMFQYLYEIHKDFDKNIDQPRN